jgi:hypothetical protein
MQEICAFYFHIHPRSSAQACWSLMHSNILTEHEQYHIFNAWEHVFVHDRMFGIMHMARMVPMNVYVHAANLLLVVLSMTVCLGSCTWHAGYQWTFCHCCCVLMFVRESVHEITVPYTYPKHIASMLVSHLFNIFTEHEQYHLYNPWEHLLVHDRMFCDHAHGTQGTNFYVHAAKLLVVCLFMRATEMFFVVVIFIRDHLRKHAGLPCIQTY